MPHLRKYMAPLSDDSVVLDAHKVLEMSKDMDFGWLLAYIT